MDPRIQKLKNRLVEIWGHAGFQRYFRNTGWMFICRIASLVVSFFVSISVARYLGPDNLGIINYSISLVGLFSFLAGLGIDSILYRDLVDRPENTDKLLGTSFILKILGTILAFIGVIITMLIVGGDSFTNMVILIIAAGYIFQSFYVIPFYFQAKVAFKSISIASLAAVFFLSLLKVVLIIAKADVIYFALVLLLEPILYAAIYWVLYTNDDRKISAWKFDRAMAKKMLALSWPLMFTSAFAAIYSRIDQVMLGFFMDVKTVGIYSIAALLSEYWYFIPIGLVNSLVPAIINGKKSGIGTYKRRLKNLSWLVIFVSLAAAIFFTIFSDKLIYLLYGVDYLAAADVLKTYVWGGIGMSLGIVVNQLLVIENKTKVIFLFAIISMLVNVVLNLFLIPRFGMNGAAVATLVSYSVIPLPILFLSRLKSKPLDI